jgi:hypothetical protein
LKTCLNLLPMEGFFSSCPSRLAPLEMYTLGPAAEHPFRLEDNTSYSHCTYRISEIRLLLPRSVIQYEISAVCSASHAGQARAPFHNEPSARQSRLCSRPTLCQARQHCDRHRSGEQQPAAWLPVAASILVV